jgi:hypothetical protein
LQWGDVDLHEGVLYVRRQWTRSNEYGTTKNLQENLTLALERISEFVEAL